MARCKALDFLDLNGLWTVVVAVLVFFYHLNKIESLERLAKVDVTQMRISLLVVTILVIAAIKRRQLSKTGAMMAAFIGGLTLTTSYQAGEAMIVFFFVANRATAFGHEKKKALRTSDSKKRTANQVLANGLIPCLFSVLAHADLSRRSNYQFAALASIASACGDTLASEITPVINEELPRCIVQPWKKVPIGTNGGITFKGILISFLGSSLTVLPLWILGQIEILQVLRIGILGLIGSIVDSILGALFEESSPSVHASTQIPYKILCNDDVNLLANLSAALIALCFA